MQVNMHDDRAQALQLKWESFRLYHLHKTHCIEELFLCCFSIFRVWVHADKVTLRQVIFTVITRNMLARCYLTQHLSLVTGYFEPFIVCIIGEDLILFILVAELHVMKGASLVCMYISWDLSSTMGIGLSSHCLKADWPNAQLKDSCVYFIHVGWVFYARLTYLLHKFKVFIFFCYFNSGDYIGNLLVGVEQAD